MTAQAVNASDTVRSALLEQAVIDRLDLLDRLVADADVTSLATAASSEITKLTSAWRAVLNQHQPDARSRCTQCIGWRRGRRFPCPMWIAAHEHLIANHRPLPSTRGRTIHPPRIVSQSPPRRQRPTAIHKRDDPHRVMLNL